MRKKVNFLFFLLFLLVASASAQIAENFGDGDFTNNPAWTGDLNDFMVNPGLQLQSKKTIANSTFYLSTPNDLATSAVWEFWIRLAFNPSSANYVDAFLISSSSDLTLTSSTGYFVRVGNTDDDVSLYRKDADGTVKKIIDGVNGILNKSNNVLKIKITRDTELRWTLFRDATGIGNSFIKEGDVIDSSYKTSSYFGFLIRQSSAGFFQRHFFDDIFVKEYVRDETPPAIVSVTVVSSNALDLLFNEPLDEISSQDPALYFVNNGIGMPVSAILDDANPALAHLSFNKIFTNSIEYTLMINAVKDVSSNAISNATTTFSFYTSQQYDVLIDELFPDPNPQVGLPLYKFLELKNVSSFPINLKGWKLIDGASTASLPSFNLLPDSFVIVCATNSASFYNSYGATIGVANFPSMNIGGATIILRSAENKTIHAVRYDIATYKNDLKKDGGWTLEMIDPKNPCGGSGNWKASADPKGGTPGKRNSVDGENRDETLPKLLRAFATDADKITLVFDEPVDSLRAAIINNYSIDKGYVVKSVFVDFPFFNQVQITLNNPIISGEIYTVTVKNIPDCAGNNIGKKNTARFGLASDADSLDLVINEILFHPLPMGADYVELYNRSKKSIDLKKVFLANRNSNNIVSSILQVSPESILLFPGDYILLSADVDAVKGQYITTNPDAFIKMYGFPSYPNAGGNVVVLNGQGMIVDEIPYSEKWHFPLIKNPAGVSLERIDFDGPSSKSNFHSAATSVGYGTPGYRNSQYRIIEELSGAITVTPQIFSPDNDGLDDFVTINYEFPSAGFVVNTTIYDASGRVVRYLQKNSLAGPRGYFRWDGLSEKGLQLPKGIYIIYNEIFSNDGRKRHFKNTVVLARK
jgi:hypothetical protein